jgi:hypothetical protein
VAVGSGGFDPELSRDAGERRQVRDALPSAPIGNAVTCAWASAGVLGVGYLGGVDPVLVLGQLDFPDWQLEAAADALEEFLLGPLLPAG